MELNLLPLFPVALGRIQLQPDPLDAALQLQTILALRGSATSNPDPGCAWTGDLQGVWQLHRHPDFAGLMATIRSAVWRYLQHLGFEPSQLALLVQRCWPVVSAVDQVIGRHHHPNAHLSVVYYLNGDGSGRSGCLRFWPQQPPNELVPGLSGGHQGPQAPGTAGDTSALPHPWAAPWHDVAPQAGLLLIFPAGLDHAVLPNDDDDDLRVSIALDLCLCARAATDPQQQPEYLAPHPSHWQAWDPADTDILP